MQTHSITLGRTIPNSGTVTNQMWIEFVKNEVCTSLEEAENYWGEHLGEVIDEIQDYMKCDFAKKRSG